MKPTLFQIFCGYYLGLDKDFQYRFFNLHSLAEHYGVRPNEILAIMAEHHILPEDTRHVNYNIAKAHATAQELFLEGKKEDLRLFARKVFEEFMQAMGGYEPRKDFENVDYDHIIEGGETEDDKVVED